MFVLTRKDQENAVVEIVNEADIQKCGIVTDKGTYCEIDAIEVKKLARKTIPTDFAPFKYSFTENAGFIKNPNFIPFYSQEQRLRDLEEAVAMLLGGAQ